MSYCTECSVSISPAIIKGPQLCDCIFQCSILYAVWVTGLDQLDSALNLSSEYGLIYDYSIWEAFYIAWILWFICLDTCRQYFFFPMCILTGLDLRLLHRTKSFKVCYMYIGASINICLWHRSFNWHLSVI